MNADKVILHHSAGQDGPENNTAGIRRWHMGTPPNGPADGPYRDVAYHALCEKVGDSYEIIMGRPWDMNGAHTVGQNSTALGICLCGNFNLAPPPDAQLLVAAKFVAMWTRIYRIPFENIFRHDFFNQTDCPGNLFDMEKFVMMVRDA
jgi:hypothetical protein